MFTIYLKTVIRHLQKNKIFSVINIAGLGTGLTCCMLILLYTKDEASYDRFHKNGALIYQLVCDRIEKNGIDTKSAITSMVQGPAFKEAIPEIQSFTRVNTKRAIVKTGTGVYNEEISWVDENFFSVFSFPLNAGNATAVLTGFNSTVVTEGIAKKYFGNSNAIGKTIEVEVNGAFMPFIISGIAKAAPQNSSIKFNIILPFQFLEKSNPDNGWMWFSFPTFFVVHSSANISSVTAKMDQVYRLRAKSEIDMNHDAGYDTQFRWGLVAFEKMHLNTAYQGMPEGSDPLYSWILTGIACFILVIACINFINLSIAQSLKRSKEIGIRKVAGSLRLQLVYQFLVESMLVCFISFVFAILAALLLLPFFNELANKKLSLTYLFDNKLIAGAVILYAVTFLAAGFYPALILSGLKPVTSLYGKIKFGGRNYLARSLVVLQFSLATLLITATLCMNAQFVFLTSAASGYNDKNLIEFVANNAIMDKQMMNTCKAAFENITGVEMVGYANVGKFGGKTQAGGREFAAVYEHIDENYLRVLQVKIAAGRNFAVDFPADVINSVLVNETFVRAAGWKDPIGKTVDFMNLPGWGTRKITVIGVVKDYHFESLKEKIKPELFTMEPQLPLGRFVIRILPNNTAATITALEKAYHSIFPDHPFQYSFKDAMLQKNYEAEKRWKAIIGFAAWITVFISCIGLFGLAMLSTENRIKEIGIRKVLGAGNFQLVQLVSMDFVKLVFIAFLFAMPAGWYIVNRWLQNFAYRARVQGLNFVYAGSIILLLALLTVSFHAVNAAVANPVKSLKNN